MTKEELIAALSKESGYPKIEIERVLIAQSIVIEGELCATGEIILPGIGKLNTAKRAARKGRNPQTGADIEIPAKVAVTFKAVKALRDAVQ